MDTSNININSLIELLVEKTQQGQCQWENEKNGTVRLVMRSGSIIFHYAYDLMTEGYEYSIKLYDNLEEFAKYHTDNAEYYDDKLYPLMDRLREAISEWQQKIIHEKMKSFFEELK